MHRSSGLTPTESKLLTLCDRTFLRLWSYPNPYRGPGKELCDLLVVCNPDVIIFSDKACQCLPGPNLKQNWRRWYKRAIVASSKQLAGAERSIRQRPTDIFTDAACQAPLPVALPDPQALRVHRIIVASGAKQACREYFDGGSGSLMLSSDQDVNNPEPFCVPVLQNSTGMVHIIDEVVLEIILRELDTIADFIDYLNKKEALLQAVPWVQVCGEEELLATYVRHKSKAHPFGFDPESASGMTISEECWSSLRSHPQYVARSVANQVSYQWDKIIDNISTHVMNHTLISECVQGISHNESALRIMARENRVSRRILSDLLMKQLISVGESNRPAFRVTESPVDPSTAYVFMLLSTCDTDDPAEWRRIRRYILYSYVTVYLWRNKRYERVLGIATEALNRSRLRSYDLLLMQSSDWSDELDEKAREFAAEFGWGDPSRTKESHYNTMEFPIVPLRSDGTLCSTRVGRNQLCPCGSGLKYKKCCGH